MPAKIIIYQAADRTIALQGDFVAGVFKLAEFQLPNCDKFKVVSTASVAGEFLIETQPGSNEFRFQPGPTTLTLTVEMLPTKPTFKFFGRDFEGEADLSARVIIRLPLNGAEPAPESPFFTLEVCGVLKLNALDTNIETEPLCLEVTLEKLPEIFPSLELPRLRLNLPDLGLRLPKLRLPWGFPELPDFPFHLPALSFLDSPVKVSWKAIRYHRDKEKNQVIIDIEHLALDASFGGIEADLHIVRTKGQIDFRETYIQFYRPDFQRRLQVPITHWHHDHDCLVLQWEEPEINAWLRMFSADLADSEALKNVKVSLRLLWDGNLLTEARFDWEAPNQARNINLPGLRVTIPPVRMYSLVLRRDDEDNRWLSLLTTFDKQAELSAVSTFSLTRHEDEAAAPTLPDERESHPEAEGKEKPLIECSIKTKRPVSLTLIDLPLGGHGRTRFFRQTTDALVPFVFSDEPTPPPSDTSNEEEFVRGANIDAYCQPINYEPTRLRVVDWEQPKLRLNLEENLGQLKDYILPFLKSDGAGNDKQFIKITRANTGLFKADEQGNYLPVVTAGLNVEANIGSLQMGTTINLDFDLERFAFRVSDDVGIKFGLDKVKNQDFLGLKWEFIPNKDKELFTLVTKDGNYQLKQAPDAKVRAYFTALTSDKEPIIFEVQNFVWAPKGISFVARVTDSPARLNGLDAKYRFTDGTLTVHENHITDFTMAGSGPLPAELAGNATISVRLHFGQRDGRLTLLNGSAELVGEKLLSSKGTRFEVSVDGLELQFVYDGRYHFYVAVTGKAKYVPQSGDDASGPLAWLPGIEVQLVKAPLTSDWKTLRKHIKFQVELPQKKSFDFLGCFKMELRSFSFVPEDEVFSPAVPSIVLGGQVRFTDNGSDVLDVRIDFHQLHIGMPKLGSFIPQFYFKKLGLSVKTAAFEMEGEVEYIDEEIEPGLLAKGFAGSGALRISGWPEIAATFTFIRVSPDGGVTWKRAWFIYIEVRKLSIPIPVWTGVYIYLREIGLGFGYRYTLASIRAADELDDPGQLIKELQRLSRTQGNLSRRDQWRVDIEGSRWTLAFRALLAQNSANGPYGSYFTWSPEEEKNLPCLFVMDAVIGLRSDLTFLMASRVWIFTNYFEFTDDADLRNRPLVSGFALFQPRKRRLLIHAASNENGKFGPSSKLPDFIQNAILASRFSFTLLAEPRLLHIEAGWPNQLGWNGQLGPLKFEFKGGAIFRVSDEHIVTGFSMLARASFELSAGISLGFVGASIRASANVAFGMRMIGAITFKNTLDQSAYYSALGIEMRLVFAVEFWIRIKIWRFKITKTFRFSFEIGLTFFQEIGITGRNFLGVRGTATVSLRIMGHGLHFGIHLGINSKAVDKARALTEKYLHIGLEAAEVEPVPGDPITPRALAMRIEPLERASVSLSEALALAASVITADELTTPAAADTPETVFAAPDYTLYSIPVKDTQGQEAVYFLLLPSGEQSAGQEQQAFLPVPPTVNPKRDFSWTPRNQGAAQVHPFDWQTGDWGAAINGTHEWCVQWEQLIADELAGVAQPDNGTPDVTDAKAFHPTLKAFLSHAFITQQFEADDPQKAYEMARPIDNPRWLPSQQRILEDQRVHHPTDDAVEAAVRGAVQQFEGSPYLKRDILSPYEESLKNAFAPHTTVYTPSGQLPLTATAQEDTMVQQQQAMQLRGVIINQLISELQHFVELETAPIRDEKALQKQRQDSLSFQLGLVFRATGRPDWMQGIGNAGDLQQRTRPTSLTPDSAVKPVAPFNLALTSFAENPPTFQRVRHYTDANTIAITWDLTWPAALQEQLTGAQKEPEEHLLYYLVRRRALAGDEREVEYTVKNVEVLNRASDNVMERLRPRFQLVDHFNEETSEDQSTLPANGRTYVYTITPVDVAGLRSQRPLTLVATRRPSEPPPVISEAELIVRYQLNDKGIEAPGDTPLVLTPDKDELWVEWPEQSDPQRHSRVAVDGYRLVLRRELTFPAGSYGADGTTQSRTTSVLPATNARPLRTDIFFDWQSSEAKTKPDPARVRITLKLADLIAKGVYPADGQWRPEAWRVFLQTRSRGNVYSTLTPVQIVLQFRTTNEDLPERREEKRPSLLEWVAQPIRFRVLPPEDEAATVGTLQVPMPQLDTDSDLRFALDDKPLAQMVAYQTHPDQLRAVRFEWNQGPSEPALYPADLHAGYRLYEFDLDAHTAEVLDAPDASFFDRLRLLQQGELLPPENLLLTPADTNAPLQWEAWYPSHVRRLQLRAQASDAANLQRSEARLSPWYSWRDSYLQWPDDVQLIDPNAPAQVVMLIAPLRIVAATQQVLSTANNLASFYVGQFVRVSGASASQNNGWKQVRSVSNTALTFEPGAFSKDEDATLTLDGSSQKGLHPFLAKLLGDVEAARGQALVANVPPTAQPGTLRDFLNATAPLLDPYGWDILKRMGLCVTFSLHDSRTGEPAGMEVTLQALRDALAKYAPDNPYFRHLHIEALFQPATSRRLEGEAASVTPQQLLALVQISLRPALKQVFGYALFEISASSDAFSGKADRSLTLKLRTGGVACRWVELNEDVITAPFELAGDGERTVTVPASGKLLLLCQSTSLAGANVEATGVTVRKQSFAPTDWLAEYFDTPGNGWPRSSAANSDVAAQWQRFNRYLLRLNPTSPANPSDPRIELPKADDLAAQEELQNWLARFFVTGGDVTPGKLFENQTQLGPWLATAYLRAVSPIGLTPDASGRLCYYHPVEDRWAHAYRYYILPHGRYDQLWETLGQSARLYPNTNDEDMRAANLARLHEFVPPSSGGLDVVWERLHSLAPPLVLYSGRLDLTTSSAVPTVPGKTWEVLLAKHPEQALIERNRTLQRQLGYRQIAHTLLRRFAYADRLDQLRAVLAQQQYNLQLKEVEGPAPQTLPGAYETPDHVNLLQPTPEEMLALGLPQRLREYTPGLLALQWEALPYFYEHRLLLVAQSNAVVSPVTDVVQRDFEYLSPQPHVELDVRTLPNSNARQLIARIRLASYWDCLPPAAQARWQIEAPSASDGATRKLSSLPDAEVAYQFLLTRSGVVEAQADVGFNAQQTAGYEARPLGKQLTVTPLRLLPPGSGEHAQDPFHLEAALTRNNMLQLKSQPLALPLSGEFTRASYVGVLFDLTETPKLPPEFERVVTRPAANASLDVREAFATEWLLARVVTTRPDTLSAALQAKVEFVTPRRQVLRFASTGQKSEDLLKACKSWRDQLLDAEMKQAVSHIIKAIEDGKTNMMQLIPVQPLAIPAALTGVMVVQPPHYLLQLRSALTTDEQAELRATLPVDQATLGSLFNALDDRDALTQLYADWNCETAISGRAEFEALAQGNDRLSFPLPTSCVLALEGKLSATEIAELFTQPLDPAFETALRQLIERMADGVTTIVEASVSFEQIAEINAHAVLPTRTEPRLLWRGAINERQQQALQRWSALSVFGKQFSDLLDAAAALQRGFPYTPTQGDPTSTDLPAVLQSRLQLTATALQWQGLLFSAAEATALETLRDNTAYGASFRAAIKALLADLTQPGNPALAVEIPMPAGWHPRPQQSTLSTALQSRLLIGNARLQFSGWMTRAEALQLQQAHWAVDREAVTRLFAQSAQVGMQGWQLTLRARRGGAVAQTTECQRQL